MATVIAEGTVALTASAVPLHSLREAVEIRAALVTDILLCLGESTRGRDADADIALAESIAVRLLALGWVVDRPLDE
jgi:hypothetical protein